MDKATVKKAMEATISLLGEISVPMALFDQVSVPIMNAMNNMRIGLGALEAEADEEAEAAEVQDGNNRAE